MTTAADIAAIGTTRSSRSDVERRDFTLSSALSLFLFPRLYFSSALSLLRGSKSPLRLSRLRDTNGVRRFARHAASEPTNECETRSTRCLWHVWLANQSRDVADKTSALAFIGQLIRARAQVTRRHS
jgi:hypothetical protein